MKGANADRTHVPPRLDGRAKCNIPGAALYVFPKTVEADPQATDPGEIAKVKDLLAQSKKVAFSAERCAIELIDAGIGQDCKLSIRVAPCDGGAWQVNVGRERI